jgi:zinc transport system substrate-binding protein
VKTRIVLTLIVASLTGCGGSSGGNAVVAAFYPLAFAAEQIGGEELEVRNLTPPGVEPHDLELSGQDVRAIADAKAVLYLGDGFQPALEDAIDSTSANGVDLLDSVSTRADDPHVWLDPQRYAALALKIGDVLDRTPEAERFSARSRALDEEFRLGLSSCERHEIVTSHAAFGYLADRYGLEQVSVTGIEPEAEPAPADLAQVVDRVRESGATTVFVEPLASHAVAETVAREADIEVATLDPLEGLTEDELAAGEDYFSVMRADLAALREGLACR